MEPCRLYVISPAAVELEHFIPLYERVLETGLVASFQLRLKAENGDPVHPDVIKRASDALIPMAQNHQVAFLINDHADLVKATGADGVHLGQSDMACADARRLLGEDVIIGVTCHNSRHLAFEAGEAGADYVAFGAFHPTPTKQTQYVATPDLLSWWQEIAELPCVAIGGITAENAAPIAQAGADFIAVSNAIWSAPDVAQATRQLAHAIGLEPVKD